MLDFSTLFLLMLILAVIITAAGDALYNHVEGR